MKNTHTFLDTPYIQIHCVPLYSVDRKWIDIIVFSARKH